MDCLDWDFEKYLANEDVTISWFDWVCGMLENDWTVLTVGEVMNISHSKNKLPQMKPRKNMVSFAAVVRAGSRDSR
jgi:hypothetical protein